MLTIICLLLFLPVFGAIIKLALKMTWGLTKVVLGIILLPVLILVLICSGVFLLAIPLLLILGAVTLGKLILSA